MTRIFHLRRVVPALRAAGLEDDAIARRSSVQEFTYLLERAGAPLGYRYTWDLLGPFSEALASVFSDADEESVRAIPDDPSAEVQGAAHKVADLRDRRAASVESEADWLHLVTCVDFLTHRSGVSLKNGSTPRFLLTRYGEPAIEEARRAVSEVFADTPARAGAGH